ncbi:dolichyl-phosphate-mannose--protein mannosyltransferase 4 [Gongronella butleri]|nr:dolichyl-phosphate-mannose--protein mannosyltransferase 4 [Gongronella butleri]
MQKQNQLHRTLQLGIMAMCAILTYFKIWHPAEVVFDEVHFGKFSSFYIRGTYFFDVHPPLAKMILAFWSYMVGYDGHFDFTSIGDSYITNRIPYISIRLLPATVNVLNCGLLYSIMRNSGHSWLTCGLTALLYAFDNAMVAQSRLILLDSFLIFFMLCSVYAFVRSRGLRHKSFTKEWWLWLFLTGAALACTLSVKLVGSFVIISVGFAVIMDLWELLDVSSGLSIAMVSHFMARVAALIVTPIILYLGFFWIHFAVLPLSGPGDKYMSLTFQATLKDSPLVKDARFIHYNDTFTIEHKQSSYFLQSSDNQYPQRYEDGRISSQGFIVSIKSNKDRNSYWRILPTAGQELGTKVMDGAVVQLQHAVSNRILYTHDVASPLKSSNMEMTVKNLETVEEHKLNNTYFKLSLQTESQGQPWKSDIQTFRLISVPHNVAISSTNKALPDWGQGHFDANGNKKQSDKSNDWIVHNVLGERPKGEEYGPDKKVKPMPFMAKFMELQFLMLDHNARLVTEHPYQSKPYTWAWMRRGIAYWQNKESRSQIYLCGNLTGWWAILVCIPVYVVMASVLAIAKRRQVHIMRPDVERRFIRATTFFTLLWFMHYFPFFMMGRDLFLHHYLPAATCGYMLVGSLYQFFFTNGVENERGATTTLLTRKSFIAASLLLLLHLRVFVFLAPLTYGLELSVGQVLQRRLLPAWDLQFAK